MPYPKMHKTAEELLGKMKGSNKKRAAKPGDADPLEEAPLEGTVGGESEDGPKPGKKKAGHFLSQGKGVTDFPDPDQASEHELGPALEEPPQHLVVHKVNHGKAPPKLPIHPGAIKHIQPHDTRTAQAPDEQGIIPNASWKMSAAHPEHAAGPGPEEEGSPEEEAGESPAFEAHEVAAMGHPIKGKSDEDIAAGFHAQLRKHFGVGPAGPKMPSGPGKRGAKKTPAKHSSGY